MAIQPIDILKKQFGFDHFRPMQEAAITAVCSGKDVLVLMPTGGGKSICYQVPALVKAGTALVVSPLIALMKDQVQALQANGIEAEFINSSLSFEENNAVKEKCRRGITKLLYMAPETIVQLRDTFLNEITISLVAIDEAHCISSWGHDFRPEYTQLGFLRLKFSNVPFIALTATADKVTRKDILQQLKLRDPEQFISSFDRKNLSLAVKRGTKESKKITEIVSLIQQHPTDSGIIYCLSRKGTEKLSGKLKAMGINCAHYHAGLASEERSAVQEAFTKDDIRVIIATVAFGMGIDKSNVRYVIHYNLPKNIESYYQEIGRAGRDGLPATTVLYFSVADIISLKRFATESANATLNLEKLRQMQELAEARICRRKILLNYFSESITENCGNCDVCKNPPSFIEGSIFAQKALSALLRAGEKIGFNMLINILRGSKSAEIFAQGFDKLKTYGKGAELSFERWQSYLMQMLQLGAIEMAYDENYALKATPFGKKIVQGEAKLHFVETVTETPTTKNNLQKPTASPTSEVKQHPLFEELRSLRKQIADSLGMPPFIVFGDVTLASMVEQLPCTEQEMLGISGVSTAKMERYGLDFMKIIQGYCEQHSRQKKLRLSDFISDEKIKGYADEMKMKGIGLSHHTLGKLLLGSSSNKLTDARHAVTFFGVLEGVTKYATLRPVLLAYFEKHFYANTQQQVQDFFAAPYYNHLNESSKQNLKRAVSSLPILKSGETLTDAVRELRKTFPRSHETWTDQEIAYYREAFKHTNDLNFLTSVFLRSENSIKAMYTNLLKQKEEAVLSN
ncbi:MAG: DNA helicase RecQ [Bacteroidetes bacterium]|nr:DNA helicase RecQ [Bacteroidota bacterium]MBP6412944.1 DNA helicase RecQ [Bacteroidia bacterium]